MSDLYFCRLGHRALIALSGEDREVFLQGLVSADVRRADGRRALYGAFLTPQGKYLHEFFLAAVDGSLLLETERDGRDDFLARLKKFRLRSRVALAIDDDWQVFALFGGEVATALGLPAEAGLAQPWGGGLVLLDPRLAAAGARAWLPPAGIAALAQAGFAEVPFEKWDRHRIVLGLPDGSRDLVPEKTILLEAGFDELGGVDWQKGCFMGQEVTARSKYRGQIKRRLMPVVIDGVPPPSGAKLHLGDNEVGEMRSQAGGLGLAVIRLDCLTRLAQSGGSLTAGGASLTPIQPDWVQFS
jgi:folate-binding protein YgfZ